MSDRLDGGGPSDVDDIEPALLTWLPLTFRAWIAPPLLLVGAGTAAIVASRIDITTHPLAWAVVGGATVIAGILYALISHPAYIDLTESEARRFRARALTLLVVLAAIALLAGLVSGSGALKFFGISPLTPVLVHARPLANELSVTRRRRNRSLLRSARLVCLVLVLASIATIAVFAPSDAALPGAVSSAVPFTLLYGLLAGAWSHVQLRRDARGR